MRKTLTFTFEGKEYVLEFTRETVRTMERMGFVADDLFIRPMTLLPDLFAGAFMAHHKGTKRKDIERIFNAMKDRGDLIGKLVEMYREPIAALTEEPDEAVGNVEWTASF